MPGWGRSPGEENGNLLQYSCLENPMDRGMLNLHTHARFAGWGLAVAWEPTPQIAWTSDSPTNKLFSNSALRSPTEFLRGPLGDPCSRDSTAACLLH